jgi:hypothetical protein
MSQIKQATGNVKVRGTVKLSDGAIVDLATSTRIPWASRPNSGDPHLFSGEVVGDKPIQFGGTASKDDGAGGPGQYKLVNYKANSGWTNVVELPPGAKFTLEVVSFGGVHSVARMNIHIHDDDASLKVKEKALRLAQIEEMYA